MQINDEIDYSITIVSSTDLLDQARTYFNLLHTLKGSGTYVHKNKSYRFQTGQNFILQQNSNDTLTKDQESSFLLINLSKQKLLDLTTSRNTPNESKEIFRLLSDSRSNKKEQNSIISLDYKTKQLFSLLINQLINEQNNKLPFNEFIANNTITFLLTLIARSLQKSATSTIVKQHNTDQVENIISYVYQNIYNKNNLSLEKIAEQFSKSKDYISQYFKKETGHSLKNHITQVRIELIKKKLISSDSTISKIAAEFGFSDESHLNRLFKKNHQMTAKQFRTLNKKS